MKVAFYLILLLLIPGLLARIGFGGAGILATDILLPIFCAVWVGKKIIYQEKFPPFSPLKSGLIFVFIAFVSYLFGAWDLLLKEQILSAAYLVRLISFLIFGWAATDIFRREDTEKFITNLLGISTIVILLGFLQFYLVPDISTYSTEGGWDPHTGRLLGTWLDPNYMAGFLGFVIPLGIARLYNSFQIPLNKGESKGGSSLNKPSVSPFSRETKKAPLNSYLLSLIFPVLALIALFLTFSRSGYLAAGMGLLFFFLWKDPKIILLGILVVGLGIASNDRAQKRVGEMAGTFASVLLQETDEIDPTASLRIQNWQKSYQLFEKYPLTGIGYNTYRYNAAKEGVVDENFFSAGGADSTHLTVLVTTGIFGFLAYLWWIWQLGWEPFRQYLKARSNKINISSPFTKGGQEGDSALKNPSLILPLKKGEQDDLSKQTTYHLAFASGLIALLVHACFVNSLFFPLIFLPVMAVAGVLDRR